MKDVTAAIIIKDNAIFIARRAPGEKFAGGWEFPGGKVEANETPEECLQRELYEEFGIKTKAKEFLAESIYKDSTGSIRLLAYAVEVISGTVTLRVHDEYKWVSVDSLLDYDLLTADISIAKKIMQDWI